jgi:hypothetical protein
MFSSWLLSILALTYLGCLFGIAFYGEHSAEATVLCQSGVDTIPADYHLGDGVDGACLGRMTQIAPKA